jgi:hypothetical protein
MAASKMSSKGKKLKKPMKIASVKALRRSEFS